MFETMSCRGFVVVCTLMLLWGAPGVHAGEFRILHKFSGSDGALPQSALISDSRGHLYGTTLDGGAAGLGTVFKLLHARKFELVHSFAEDEAQHPFAGLAIDPSRNLYGVALNQFYGFLYVVTRDGQETTLHAFDGGNEGAGPMGRLLRDEEGNLFGTTVSGGKQGAGTVFQLAPDATQLTVLHSFSGGADGGTSIAGLIADSAGNLYGTTEYGGDPDCRSGGCGVVFKITPDHKETVLHAFNGSLKGDGAQPLSELVIDDAGNLYGTTSYGGQRLCGCGTVFKIAPDGKETILYAFQKSDGSHPAAGLVRDAEGNLYGTTAGGGDLDKCQGGCGVVFKLAPDGTEMTLHVFNGRDGQSPSSTLLLGQSGSFYGSALFGGLDQCNMGCGTIFRLTP